MELLVNFFISLFNQSGSCGIAEGSPKIEQNCRGDSTILLARIFQVDITFPNHWIENMEMLGDSKITGFGIRKI